MARLKHLPHQYRWPELILGLVLQACIKQHEILKAAGDIAATGWMLAALEERINEGDLPDWEELRKVADKAVGLLQGSKAASSMSDGIANEKCLPSRVGRQAFSFIL